MMHTENIQTRMVPDADQRNVQKPRQFWYRKYVRNIFGNMKNENMFEVLYALHSLVTRKYLLGSILSTFSMK